jgi:AraC family transcriptional regulator
MQVEFAEKGAMTLAGMSYYGSLTGEGWSRENPIGQLWERFNRFFDQNPSFAQQQAVKPGIGYEISIWNEEELQESKCFYVFVGVEVQQLDDMPLELVGKVLPASSYAHLTPQGREITTWERTFYDEWLPGSGYQLATYGDYHCQIQAYEEGRFKGLGDLLEESEIDVFIPVENRFV